MSARSARRPLPALIFLVALLILAVLVWVRVTQRDSNAQSATPLPVCSSAPTTGELPANASITVNVLNGNGTTGLAASTLKAFQGAGFVAGRTDTVTTVTGVGTITAGPQGTAAAKVVQFYVPGATLGTDSSSGSTVTVTVGPQFSAIASADAVKAAMAAAKVSQAPAATAPSGSPAASATSPAAPTASASPTCRPS